MLVISRALEATDLPRGGVATVGNYDGVHRGQQRILERTVERARELGGPALVITFDPHPLAVLRPEAVPPRLTTPAQKERLLAGLGIDALLIVPFTNELASTSAERFARDMLASRLGLRELVVGSEFALGRGREGKLAVLARLGEELGFRALGVEETLFRGERISSTRIRQSLAEGRVEEAAEMLGRPYALTGKVERGDRMGKRLGWPTVNLAADGDVLLADGVYACQVRFPQLSGQFDGATNVGTRPTVYENYRRVVETHVLDFDADVYGEQLELEFHRRLREERTFATVMDLSAQIRRDVSATREYFSARRRSL